MDQDRASEDGTHGIEGLNLELDPALQTLLEKYTPLVSPHLRSNNGLDQVEDVTDSDGQPNLLQKQKSWHQRRREEILRLREEVRELTRTLQHQQDISRVQGQHPIAGATCGSLSMLETSTPRNMLSLWESMAKRELARLQVSSDENLRLRELVRQHELQMKTLQRTFKRRLRSIASVVPSKPSLSCPSLGLSKRKSDVFVELLGGLDELYGDLDNCFKRVKADEVPCPGRREDSMKYQDGNMYVELLDCYVVPFDLSMAAKAVWALKTTSAGECNASFAEYFAADDNTRMKTVCMQTSRHGLDMRVVAHVAVRKYVEQDRTAFISRMLVEPIQDLFAVAFKETVRLVLRPGKPSATGPTTVLQTHCQATVHETLDRGAIARWKASSYYAPGVEAWVQSVTHFNHRVEDMLVRESLRRPTRSGNSAA